MVEQSRMGVEVKHQDLRQLLIPIHVGLTDKTLDNPEGMLLIYAGGSISRLDTLRKVFPLNQVYGQIADPEPLAKNVAAVSLHKAGVVHRDKIPHRPGNMDAIIAVDTLTSFPKVQNGRAILVTHGKIDTAFDVPKHFFDIDMASDLTRSPPGYSVASHSVLLYRNSELKLFEDPCTVNVQLYKEVAQRLTTQKGLADYLIAFHELYDGILNPKMVLEKISAGIDLLPLVYMRAIESINGITFEDSRFREALRYATFVVTVGISPRILRLLGVQKDEIIPKGSFIDVITERALRGNTTPHQIIRQ